MTRPDTPFARRRARRRALAWTVGGFVAVCAVVAATTAFAWRHEIDSAVNRQVAHDDQAAVARLAMEKGSKSAHKTASPPNLPALIGRSEAEALGELGPDAVVTRRREFMAGREARRELTVVLTAEEGDNVAGTPTVRLTVDREDTVRAASYSCPVARLGYAPASFADLVARDHVVQKTFAEAGVEIPADATPVPADRALYTTLEADGRTVAGERLTFQGDVREDGRRLRWWAAVDFDYALANASGNQADTQRRITVALAEA